MSTPPRLAGASRLLDREPPADYLREWTQRIAAAREEKTAGSVSVLIFGLGGEWLALPTGLLQEVAEGGAWHSLPHRPGAPGAGLVNIRGELLLTVSLGALLGLETPRPPAGRRLLVTSLGGARLVFPVDEVAAVHRYDPAELRPVPATVSGQRVTYTTGLFPWGERTVGGLAPELLFETFYKGLA